MIKDKSEMPSKIQIDLTGPDGNAFVILAHAKRLSKDINNAAGEKVKDWNAIMTEMMSGDYENLLKVFEREFGDYVIMYR